MRSARRTARDAASTSRRTSIDSNATLGVEFPANFAAAAGDAYKAAKMREELRATGKITLASAGDPPGVDGVPVPVPDPFGDDDAAGAAETAEDETRRKIAEGMARIARLDENFGAARLEPSRRFEF